MGFQTIEKKAMSEESAFNRLSGLCARTEYCLSDIRGKLQRWALPAGAELRIVERLLSEKYIDENRYAHAFVRSKFRNNRWGSDKIARMLKQKGISDEDIADGLTELDDSETSEVLRSLLVSKMRSVKYSSDYELYMKLLRFAVSRGFPLESAKRSIEELIKSNDRFGINDL